MARSSRSQNCPICSEYSVGLNRIEEFFFLLECERCGKYKITDVQKEYFDAGNLLEYRHLMSAWIRRQNKSGNIPQIGGYLGLDIGEWVVQLSNMGFPKTITEKLDELLLAYTEIVDDKLQGNIFPVAPHIISDIAAKNMEEVTGLTNILGELGYLNTPLIIESTPYSYISANGWKRVDELRKVAITNNSTFVAMWFNEVTQNYREAVIAAIDYCGYKAIVVDQQEYNDFIMNQVISLIRQSRFLVADFTSRPEIENDNKVKNGVRGGVYWEAGMAYGLGRPVIHTCEDNKDSRSRIHFDVHQYNTIFWKEDELRTEIRPLDQPIPNPNFAEKLATRILATVGRGTYTQDK